MTSESATSQRRVSDRTLFVVILAWCALVATGLYLLWGYAATPGGAGTPPTTWPVGSRINRDGGFELVFFAHPLPDAVWINPPAAPAKSSENPLPTLH